MKLVTFSDPHIDIQEKRGYPRFLIKLNEYLDSLEPDIILVTGDIAGSTSYIQKFLEGITTSAKKKIFCPGNHDIWVNSKSHDASWIKYYQILPELSRELGWHYLPRQPLIVDNVAFVGTIGWYDYSTRNPIWDDKISSTQYANKYNEFTGAVWMDREFVRFGKYTDKAVANHFALDLIKDLKEVLPNFSTSFSKIKSVIDPKLVRMEQKLDFTPRHIETIVIGSHIVPFLEFVKFSGGLGWDYFSAFIGNETLGKIISSISDNIKKISVFGHTHFPQRKQLKLNLEAICCPIGYPSEWESSNSNLDDLFQNRIVTLDL